MLLFSFIGLAKSAGTCNSFPRIFGGNKGATYLYQIDVYNNYLALSGSTNDKDLTGITSSL